MNPSDYRAALAALGLTQAAFGRLLALDKATPNRWATGAVPVPRSVALLLQLLASGKVTLADIESL